MRPIASLILLSLLALSSCAATLRFGGTAPTHLNDGTCTAPILIPASSLQMIHARDSTTAREDSVAAMPGLPWIFSWQVPAGAHRVRVWATIVGRPDLISCDTTVTIAAPARPHTPRITSVQ